MQRSPGRLNHFGQCTQDVPRQTGFKFLNLPGGHQGVFGISPVILPPHAAHRSGHLVTFGKSAVRCRNDLPHSFDAKNARELFERLGYTNITAISGDGSRGFPAQAPFDRILVTAAAEDPPGPLLAELKTGGIMVVPVGQSDTVQTLIKVTRSETGYDYEELRPVRFVPLVEGMGQD